MISQRKVEKERKKERIHIQGPTFELDNPNTKLVC